VTGQTLNAVQLYPREMNIYGDNGNLEVLALRARLYGIDLAIAEYEPGDDPARLAAADILLGGGGQDSGQARIAADLASQAARLRDLVADGVAGLMVCGMYQLFGRQLRLVDGSRIAGAGVYRLTTVAGPQRLIGNIAIVTELGPVVGYENHAGLTTLDSGQVPFGQVTAGAGNNGRDGTEGARTGNCFGTYLHGPILPKNPRLADELLRLALARRDGSAVLTPRDQAARDQLDRLDDLAGRASAVARQRPR